MRPGTQGYINECTHGRYVRTQTHSGYRCHLAMRRAAIHKSSETTPPLIELHSTDNAASYSELG